MSEVQLTAGHVEKIDRLDNDVQTIIDLITKPAEVLGELWTSITASNIKIGGREIAHIPVNFYYDTPSQDGKIKITGTLGIPIINVFVPAPNPRGSVSINKLWTRTFSTVNNIFELKTDKVGIGLDPIPVDQAELIPIDFKPFNIKNNELAFALYDSGDVGNCAMHIDMTDNDNSVASWQENVARMLVNPNELCTQMNIMSHAIFDSTLGKFVPTNEFILRPDINRRQFKATFMLPVGDPPPSGTGTVEQTCIKTAAEYERLTKPKYTTTINGVTVYRWFA